MMSLQRSKNVSPSTHTPVLSTTTTSLLSSPDETWGGWFSRRRRRRGHKGKSNTAAQTRELDISVCTLTHVVKDVEPAAPSNCCSSNECRFQALPRRWLIPILSKERSSYSKGMTSRLTLKYALSSLKYSAFLIRTSLTPHTG